ncbi:MAG: 2-C-methyl-D-erythritol 4-phosphate cytidylyltransferase, partial [Verrucomicrobiota bacterium]|nr:2-C-methyl-D-erythritol 4-phosphate cytidylyltransferase [Verrucomicrobiota bacterium]
AVEAFDRTESVTEIIIVAREDRHSEMDRIVCEQGWKKVQAIVAGGEHRQDSVRAGLGRLGSNARFVAVHDAARPLITPQQIESVFEQCRAHGAAALAEPITDTLKRADKDLAVSASIDRHQLFAMQTPQIFARDLIEEAYRAVFAADLRITDDVSALEHVRRKVVLVPNDEFNFKITYERDLKLAEFILRRRTESARLSR